MTTRVWTVVFVLIVGVLYCGALNRLSLTDPDEVFYSQTAKEMMQQSSYVTPLIFGHPQYEKPPLFYWLLIAAFKMAGVTRAAARFVSISWVVDARLVSPRLRGWREDALGDVDYSVVRSLASSRRP